MLFSWHYMLFGQIILACDWLTGSHLCTTLLSDLLVKFLIENLINEAYEKN